MLLRSYLSAGGSAADTLITLDGISHSYGDRRVLKNLSFTVAAGERAGLIGENGSGKSTLLRLIAGRMRPDAGKISFSGGTETPRVGLLAQESPFDPRWSMGQAIETAIAPARRVAAAVEAAAINLSAAGDDPEAAQRYSDALLLAELHDAWNIEARVSETLTGLGLVRIGRGRPIGELSGGQRARLALACLLLSRPDVLLLDEPTNHLDDGAVEYLEGWLTAWPQPVIMASHDRAFLEQAANLLLDLDPTMMTLSEAGPGGDATYSGHGITRFSGSYTEYMASSREQRARWAERYRGEQNELRRLRASLRSSRQVGHSDWKPRTEIRMAKKFYADRNARVVSRRLTDARARLRELEESQLRRPPGELRFAGLTVAESPRRRAPGEVLLDLRDVSVAGRLGAVSLGISGGEKLLLTGRNGSGKSTLLQVIAGELAPDSGHVRAAGNMRIALLGQEVRLPLAGAKRSSITADEAYRQAVGPGRAELAPLTKFGLLSARDLHRPIEALSLGQLRRLELAMVLAEPPDLLLLDEPSNHLSITLVTELEEAIATYPGAVIVASHDRWIRRQWDGRRLALPAATFTDRDSSYQLGAKW